MAGADLVDDLLVLLVTMRPVSTGKVPGLPEFPAAGFAWNYDAASQTLQDFDYTYDLRGNIAQVIDGDRNAGPHQMYLLVVYIEIPNTFNPVGPLP